VADRLFLGVDGHCVIFINNQCRIHILKFFSTLVAGLGYFEIIINFGD